VSDPQITRTEWAERQVEEFLSLPLISEFVFRSPKHNDPTEKEVIDLLILHKGQSILISQKAQDDPAKRTVLRNELWVLKNIQDALKPICGAIRKPDERPKWCEHRRRGRVEFAALPPILHGIVLAETWRPVDLSFAATNVPLDYDGVPISYLSINDFLNLVVQLRTVPELLEYINARRSLPIATLHIVGDERPLFELYLINGGNLKGCTGHADAKRAAETHSDLLQEALDRNAEYQFYNSLIEHVADCLAERDPDYAQGLSSEALRLFDPDDKRKNYLMLQEILTDLRLRERAEFGRALYEAVERTARKEQGLTFRSGYTEGRDLVFLFVASRKWRKSDLFNAVEHLTGAALAYYQKSECLVIVDRDSEHYDVALSQPGYKPTPEDVAAGEKYFGRLRTDSVDISQL